MAFYINKQMAQNQMISVQIIILWRLVQTQQKNLTISTTKRIQISLDYTHHMMHRNNCSTTSCTHNKKNIQIEIGIYYLKQLVSIIEKIISQKYRNRMNYKKIQLKLFNQLQQQSKQTSRAKKQTNINKQIDIYLFQQYIFFFFFFLNITMWAGVPSEPLCLHTQSLATAQNLQHKFLFNIIKYNYYPQLDLLCVLVEICFGGETFTSCCKQYQ
eukprot:TRINITY_DN5268_c0_g1_i7.p1 TRINITY_DN5268_c0_g1~~TRINITY_DN5268_c0_g1_i7.p1  ORF type:complete len:214 (+),score=-16.22 TRINITY_DN5268_c0_g1_i7:429-1070(+)